MVIVTLALLVSGCHPAKMGCERYTLLSLFVIRGTDLSKFISASSKCVLVGGLLTAAVCLYVMYAGYSPTPFGDQWTLLREIQTTHNWFSLHWLWSQHNEHRYPFLRLLMLADLSVSRGNGALLLTLTFFTLAAHSLLWLVFLKKVAQLPPALWATTGGLFCFCLFSPSQWENLVWAFQWAFVAAYFFASAACISLVWFSLRKQPGYAVAAAGIGAFLAESNIASGLLLWPVLWCGALCLPFRRAHKTVLFLAGSFGIAVYLAGYRTPAGGSHPLHSLRHVSRLIRYCLRFITQPLRFYVAFPGLAGLLLLCLVGFALWLLLRNRETRAAAITFCMILVFILATAIATALGRMQFGVDQAGSSRYETPVLLFWACASAALVMGIWRLQSQRDVLTFNIIALLTILVPLGNFKELRRDLESRAQSISLAGQSLDYGVRDPAIQSALAIDLNEVIPVSNYLHSLGDHAGPVAPLPKASVITAFDKSCIGWFDLATAPLVRFQPGPPTIRADGWAFDGRSGRALPEVGLIDDQNKVIAIDSLHFFRGDVIAANPRSSGLLGWRMYSALPSESIRLRAAGIAGDHACLLGRAFLVSSTASVPAP